MQTLLHAYVDGCKEKIEGDCCVRVQIRLGCRELGCPHIIECDVLVNNRKMHYYSNAEQTIAADSELFGVAFVDCQGVIFVRDHAVRNAISRRGE